MNGATEDNGEWEPQGVYKAKHDDIIQKYTHCEEDKLSDRIQHIISNVSLNELMRYLNM